MKKRQRERSAIGRPKTPYPPRSWNTQNIFVHEFGHAVKGLGLVFMKDHSFIRAYENAYIHAKQTGLWKDAAYANSNQEEFFAELSEIWFECTNERKDTIGPVNTKAELKIFDPQSYALFASLYPDARLPESCGWDYAAWFKNNEVVTVAPAVQMPADPVDPDQANLPPEEYHLDADYFKIYSYLGTNAVQYEDGISTWWDFSNSWLNYNFDALSWRVSRVGDYYRFHTKTQGLALMAENRGTTVGTHVTAGAVNTADDSQLWKLVRVKGYFCQLINKASGLALSTENGILPGDGTQLVLATPSKNPVYGQQWRVIRLKDKPGDDNLIADKYCIRPTRETVNSLPFADVAEGAWYHDAVKTAYDRGILTGTAKTVFSPDTPMTRGMLAVALYRMNGSPAAHASARFSDVPANVYCNAAAGWMAENHLSDGDENGKYYPDREVTREQMAVILYRYAQMKQIPAGNTNTNLDSFSDRGQISGGWVAAVAWAVSEGLLRGNQGNLTPRNSMGRAQGAVILARYLKIAGI